MYPEEKVHNFIIERLNSIYQVFCEYYGENRVDLQKLPSVNDIKSLLENTFLSHLQKEYFNLTEDDFKKIKLASEKKEYNLISKHEDVYIIDYIKLDEFLRTYMDNASPCIIIHFPEVKVTNENNRNTIIKDLYVKIKFYVNGLMKWGFFMIRSKYSYEHFYNKYIHSHVPILNYSELNNFKGACTGTGPINNTINTLNSNYNLDILRLYCLELDNFTKIESLAGGPYIRLEELSVRNTYLKETFEIIESNDFIVFNNNKLLIKHFFKYIITSKILKFSYVNGSYFIAYNFTDYMILLSNLFIEWYNKQYINKEYYFDLNFLIREKVLMKTVIKDNKIYLLENIERLEGYDRYINTKILDFKGKEVLLSIEDQNILNENKNTSLILNREIALYILNNLLRIINYKYGK